MLLTFSQIKKATEYDRRRGYDEALVKRIQRLVGTDDDGSIGGRTVEAVALWQQANGLEVDGKIGPGTMAAMEKALPADPNKKPAAGFLVEPDAGLKPELLDRIAEGGRALRRKSIDTNTDYQGLPRSAAGVDGIVLHQMGFSRGDEVEKYYKVTAHFIVTPSGAVAQLHDITASLYSSNYLNRTTVAVEFAGNLRNDRGAFQGGYSPTLLTGAQVAAGRFLLDHVKTTYGIRKVFAHRQATGPRRANCCGPEIWRSVAQHAIDSGGPGFEDTTAMAFGDGSPIPDTWKK
jgi:peptidoglycan hydrolase-like protein with peptidoglycan-binding domain